MALDNAASRREFLRMAGAVGSGLVLSACLPFDSRTGVKAIAAPAGQEVVKASVEEVLPVEDLMREHGVLRRVLLLYRDAIRRLQANEDVDARVIASAADLVKRFIEDYHEKLEEEHVFPHFTRAGKHADLVRILKDQHDAGRRLTTRVKALATARTLSADDRTALANRLGEFIRMYEPHAAREDTVLFPAFRSVITPKQYDAYGDLFEDREKELFGSEGFERIVAQVAELERRAGLNDLSQFTPR